MPLSCLKFWQSVKLGMNAMNFHKSFDSPDYLLYKGAAKYFMFKIENR